jgi:hypothetical protein
MLVHWTSLQWLDQGPTLRMEIWQWALVADLYLDLAHHNTRWKGETHSPNCSSNTGKSIDLTTHSWATNCQSKCGSIASTKERICTERVPTLSKLWSRRRIQYYHQIACGKLILPSTFHQQFFSRLHAHSRTLLEFAHFLGTILQISFLPNLKPWEEVSRHGPENSPSSTSW